MKAILFNSQLKTKSGHSLNSLFSYRPRENGEGDGKKETSSNICTFTYIHICIVHMYVGICIYLLHSYICLL